MIPYFWVDDYSSHPSDVVPNDAYTVDGFAEVFEVIPDNEMVLHPGMAVYIVGGRSSIVQALSSRFGTDDRGHILTQNGNVAISELKKKHAFGKNRRVVQLHGAGDGGGIRFFDTSVVPLTRVR